jgi:UDP-3-O-[3-hydroxymyristoyl] glucosamine N-acyltransferase
MDNMAHIGQDSDIGPHSILISKSHVGQKVVTGPYFLVAAISCIGDGVNLGPVTQVAGHSWVNSSWTTPRMQLAGEPARDFKEEQKDRSLRMRAAKIYREIVARRRESAP